jgi:hypothetical protein
MNMTSAAPRSGIAGAGRRKAPVAATRSPRVGTPKSRGSCCARIRDREPGQEASEHRVGRELHDPAEALTPRSGLPEPRHQGGQRKQGERDGYIAVGARHEPAEEARLDERVGVDVMFGMKEDARANAPVRPPATGAQNARAAPSAR